MDRKKELKQQYKETPIEAGVYKITNLKNGKICVVSTRNVKTINGVKFSLENGGHTNKKLVEEWKMYGKEAFEFEVIEILKPKDDPYYNEKEELTKLEDKWLDILQPFGERGYNAEKKN
ncbi:GIY-YIG nuclease family protein [Bacillus sp. B1-b2]|uniref:GIY-YIG nuclease family protein n=1 Tax=Bacillus sp. B1-b2 TaxID=2653201 RepID=UPI0012620391|nr:GIY-YIG nuclease family protein [Bacillus sp. B1-b2]KAB7671786.1 GIY-YIG nuclease family protein [Bacillus sp. B1-b2]